jgi:hypothetical protein
MDRTTEYAVDTPRYAKCIEVSRRIRWDIDKDVIRGREFDFSEKFLPDTISGIDRLWFLDERGKIRLSQIQGRTYANMFALVERFICAKIIGVSHDHLLGDQIALESLVRFTDEELKHQELFRRIEEMIAGRMPEGYRFIADTNAVARTVLEKRTWAVLALISHIELFTQSHYKESIAPDENVSALFKDVFLYHWREESQHAILDELEWEREDSKITAIERDLAVDDLIGLLVSLDNLLREQSDADTEYFLKNSDRDFDEEQQAQIRNRLIAAYRWQYIVSGLEHPRFISLLSGMIDRPQMDRIRSSIATVLN